MSDATRRAGVYVQTNDQTRNEVIAFERLDGRPSRRRRAV